MAPLQTTEDYYAILEVQLTTDDANIKASYKRLARLKHPDKDLGNPNATVNFQMLEAAYSTLSDPGKRKLYDLLYRTIRLQRPNAHGSQFGNSTPTGFGSTTTQTGSSYQGTEEIRARREQLDRTIQESVRKQANLRSNQTQALAECEKTQAALYKLQAEAKSDTEEESHNNSWAGYFASFVRDDLEAKELRARRAIDRGHATRLREADLQRNQAALAKLSIRMRELESEVVKAQAQKRTWERQEQQREEEARAAERSRREAEQQAERRQREAEARKAEVERQEQARRRSEERAKHAREARERGLREGEAAEREADYLLRELERQRQRVRNQRQTNSNGRAARQDTTDCRHLGWWERVEGRRVCAHCSMLTKRFAFQCPQCQVLACAPCRPIMKSNGRSGV